MRLINDCLETDKIMVFKHSTKFILEFLSFWQLFFPNIDYRGIPMPFPSPIGILFIIFIICFI
jgi:hypothetical protein